MKISEIFKVSLKALLSNKARSFLTMLGVIIGVFAVVTLVSLGQGIQNYITDEFDALGSNLIFISPGKLDVADDPGKQFTRNKLAEKHLRLIETHAGEYLQHVTPYILAGDTTTYKTNSYFSEIVGVDEDSMDLFNYVKDSGRNFTKAEVKSNANVAVIGPVIVEELFATQNPIGKKIKLGKDTYEIIGTFEEKGSNYDDHVLIPYTSALDSFEIEFFSSIVAKANSTENVDLLTREVELALARDLKVDEFTVLSQQDLLSSIQEILSVLTAGLGAIAGISLLVGGIGIMNIMLVSVTERIREIGLRKALGATPNTIGLQFMAESVLLSVVGGGIGLLLGFLVTYGVQSFVRAEVTPGAVALAFGFSTVVGIIFGTYPAYNASKLDPIEALRYE